MKILHHITNLHLGAIVLNIVNISVISIFGRISSYGEGNDTHPQFVVTLGMNVAPKTYVGGGALPFVFHVYIIRKHRMASATVKKASHLSFCGEN